MWTVFLAFMVFLNTVDLSSSRNVGSGNMNMQPKRGQQALSQPFSQPQTQPGQQSLSASFPLAKTPPGQQPLSPPFPLAQTRLGLQSPSAPFPLARTQSGQQSLSEPSALAQPLRDQQSFPVDTFKPTGLAYPETFQKHRREVPGYGLVSFRGLQPYLPYYKYKNFNFLRGLPFRNYGKLYSIYKGY
ncbi:uncharacterized protein LOC117174863 [Belonocnema kinseyi]|uniref:uncharacterized protein LOC117174863 n=1 Tax=Belonocnema kinseyi TaxID=2817044 RepID=UPI00143D20BE|nr:uncharacterized protein LOC117174863 [Belonocnema kinseyi]